MKVTAPRASLPPNPEGFGFSPRCTSRGERQKGERGHLDGAYK